MVGFGVGLVALLYLGRLWQRPARPKTISLGPGAMSVAEAELAEPAVQAAALRTGMGIAVGTSLHNFSEGLAIGQAANGGQLALAGLLIVGFALHNMTQGFGNVGPLAAAKVRASWGWLGLAGPIGGGPTFLGTIIGTWFSSTYLFGGFWPWPPAPCCMSSVSLLPIGRRLSRELTLWGLLAGFLLELASELILDVAGG